MTNRSDRHIEASEVLSQEQLDHLAEKLAKRKQQHLDEIRDGLGRVGAGQRYEELTGAVGDAGDESVAIPS